MSHYEFEAKPTLNGSAVTWQLCVTKPTSQAACGTAPNYPGVSVPQGQGNQSFKFTITNDNTQLGIMFAPSPPPQSNPGPIWAQAGSKPTGPVLDGQIQTPNGAQNGGKMLTFVDQNNNQGTLILKYQLNFVDQQGNAVTAIDPDITNGGKSVAHPSQAVILAIAAAILLVVVATVVIRMRARNT
jgi:hypothetical protein